MICMVRESRSRSRNKDGCNCINSKNEYPANVLGTFFMRKKVGEIENQEGRR